MAASGVSVNADDVDAVSRSLERIQSAAATLLQPPSLDETGEAFLSAAGGRRREWGRPVNDPTALTLREAATAISQGRLRAEALVEACLDRIERLQPALNCFIRVTADAARAKARARRIWRSRQGARLVRCTAYRSRIRTCSIAPAKSAPAARKSARTLSPITPRPYCRNSTAPAVSRLGRLNMAEFAMGPTGHNDHFGRCRNPWNTDHITGGSSSGSGAAVAAGLAFGALGSDTGDRSDCRRRHVASSASSRRSAVSAGTERCRCRTRSTASACWRAMSATAHGCCGVIAGADAQRQHVQPEPGAGL